MTELDRIRETEAARVALYDARLEVYQAPDLTVDVLERHDAAVAKAGELGIDTGQEPWPGEVRAIDPFERSDRERENMEREAEERYDRGDAPEPPGLIPPWERGIDR